MNTHSKYKEEIEYVSGALFKKLRKSNKLTMKEASEIIGINPRTIQRWESSGRATMEGYRVLSEYLRFNAIENVSLEESKKIYDECSQQFLALSHDGQILFSPDPRALIAAPSVNEWQIFSNDDSNVVVGRFSIAENTDALNNNTVARILTIDVNARFFYADDGTLYRLDRPLDPLAEVRRIANSLHRNR